MKTYVIGTFGKARVWAEEFPAARYDSANELLLEQTAEVSRCPANTVVVEVCVPRGGRAEYALLGCTWRPAKQGKGSLVVAVSPKMSSSFGDALASSDDVRVGLPNEYALAVFEVLSSLLPRLGLGELRIDHAAHGLIGSNKRIFRKVAQILPELLFAKTGEEVSEALRNAELG